MRCWPIVLMRNRPQHGSGQPGDDRHACAGSAVFHGDICQSRLPLLPACTDARTTSACCPLNYMYYKSGGGAQMNRLADPVGASAQCKAVCLQHGPVQAPTDLAHGRLSACAAADAESVSSGATPLPSACLVDAHPYCEECCTRNESVYSG